MVWRYADKVNQMFFTAPIQWRIQGFLDGGANRRRGANLLFAIIFAANCMKMKQM